MRSRACAVSTSRASRPAGAACSVGAPQRFTTLGFGDLNPLGALRIIASLKSLTGLVLIGWSASFTYLSMQEFWEEHRNVTR